MQQLQKITDNLNLERQKLAPTLSEIGDSLELALKDVRIADSTEERLKEPLKYAMMKLGIRAANIPKSLEKDVLTSHIRQYYGGHTVSEIRLAFDMALTGKLDLGDNDVNCFENFSCAYFSTIMNAYRKWSKEQVKEIQQVRPQQLSNSYITSQEEKEQEIKELEQKETLVLELIPLYLYEYMIELKTIEPTNEEKFDYLEKAAKYRLQDLEQKGKDLLNKDAITDYNQYKKQYEAGELSGHWVNNVKNLAKKMIVYDYWQTCRL